MSEEQQTSATSADAAPVPPKVVWDDSDLQTSYANVVNVTSTREEVTLFFGTNLTWNVTDPEYKVKLTDRIVVNPFAAKRMLALLAGVLKEYESRYGELDLPSRNPSPTKASSPPASNGKG
ncbi:DUF3467 domain-containing protein [Kiloniella sp.]|uniref:DUF3467 domain-containing protein n=1 Tax=Kiloniella sp. TaxID=1938587 RepID=UPI003B024F87